MKKSLKIVCVLMIIMSMTMLFSNICFATGANWASSTIDDANNNWSATGNVTTHVKSVMGTAIEVIRIVGTGISIIMLTYIAIKYMSAAPNEKADFKKSATGFIVGAVVLFASTNILKIIVDFAEAVTATAAK